MSPEKQTLLMLKGAFTELPADQAEAVNTLAAQIREAVKEAGEVGMLAIALVGAEMAAVDA